MDNLASYMRAIDELKALPFDLSALLLVDGDWLKMLVAWRWVSVEMRAEPSSEAIPDAWRMTGFSCMEWAGLARVKVEVVVDNWLNLVRLGVIYPDNTYPEDVEEFIRARAE